MAIAEDGTSKTYIVNVYKVTLDDNNYLMNINIEFEDGYEIIPEFNKEIQEYKVTLPRYYFYKNIKIVGEAESTRATVTGNGVYTYGNSINTKNSNTNYTDYPDSKQIILQVMSEAGETRDYKIIISQEIDNNAYLSNIEISNKEYALQFNKETLEYELEVKSSVEQLIITGTPESIGAKVTGNGKKNLDYGENEIILNVLSEDGITQKDYVIKITRKEEPNISNYLISITTDKGELIPQFEKTNLYYDIDVSYEVTEININATKEDERAALVGDGKYKLDIGENYIYLEVTTQEGGTRTYTICVNRNESTESRLERLEIGGTILNPGFNRDTYEYSVVTNGSELDFKALEPVDKNAKVFVSGNSFTKPGEYKVIIVVTAPDKKTTSTYILTVTKKQNNNNNLASLEVYGYEIAPEFEKDTILYTLTVENNVQTVMVGAVPEEKTSKVEGTGEINLQVGLNKVQVVVTSEAGSKRTYTIEITKKASSDNLIKELEINNGSLNEEFRPEQNNYTVNLPYSDTSLDLNIILNDPSGTYEVVGNENLKVGENEVKIIVTAEDGTKNTYTLIVNRARINSAYLEELKANGYEISPEFNKYINKYTLKVNYETTSLNLRITPEDEAATYTVEGNADFKVGINNVIITVVSSLGDLTQVYEIEVERQKDVDNYLLMLYTSHRKSSSKL
ncbi:MAG: cadherin-like beta sandwich domain-containing protein [Clostridia bacterium]|nr:cadherin-like beta sandwich domain-containing protein [Clostridia bacterium]